MKKLLDERISIIVSMVLGTGTGWSLSGFITAVEIKQWLTGIAIAFSLMVSLIISAYYKSNRRKIRKSKFWRYSVICAAFFIIMLIAFFLSYKIFEVRLFVNSPTIEGNTQTTDSTFIKGLYYTPDVENVLKHNRHIDFPVLFEDSGRSIDKMWSTTSRLMAKLIILFSYLFFIASFIATITITTEILKEDTPAAPVK